MPIWRLERGAVCSNTWWVKQGNLLRNGHINASSTRPNGVVATAHADLQPLNLGMQFLELCYYMFRGPTAHNNGQP
jgi:hypothetical protein